ncbi:MAG: LysE family translocator [Candidatus Nitrosopumilus limneticus]|nr:LysE family translocator [Candidatus Nitrosopumilus limneticus]MDC4213294.1 LysE family translocator [Candidatus Nitrosopumilus limneticus]MDC4214287.1 LysE family translocator [Candidatus Nitrosopumilus limneticus]MDC4215470.1 LysE family translocator [Candidatus Nitrosopumilus limneticus]MDC4219863.1 LysE family translocator [Candidatus Nitrosopumilus limneticus]
MIQIIEFASLVIIISASGVMSPGPLFAANITYGLREGVKSGIKIAIGHSIVEIPLVILLGIGVFSLEIFSEFKTVISIFGAFTLFGFAAIQIKTILEKNQGISEKPTHGPVITGILLSALNPFFIIWWITIGFKLISDSMIIWAFAGILIVFVSHIWMDFAWLGITAYLASKSKKIISNRNYKIMILGLSITLIYFGITFLIDGIT